LFNPNGVRCTLPFDSGPDRISRLASIRTVRTNMVFDSGKHEIKHYEPPVDMPTIVEPSK
jgi:hypothetical protein